MIWLFSIYIFTVIFGCITYQIYKAKGFVFREPDEDIAPFYLIVLTPVFNIIGIFMIIHPMVKKDKPPINYELKYKTLKKMIIIQKILTEGQIQDLEDAATLMDKLLL